MRDRYASVHLDVDPMRTGQTSPTELPERPLDIVLLGDFSAREHRAQTRERELRPLRVDRDDFDEVLERLAPRLRLELGGGTSSIEVGVRELNDLHPDGLYPRIPLFARLRDLRRRAREPDQLGAVLAELRGDPPPTAPPPVSSSATGADSAGGVLDLILDETSRAAPGPDLDRSGGFDATVRRLVAPHLLPRADPRQAEVLAAIDAALAEGMRHLLHHPDFQAVEALWRAVFLLVRRVETGRLLRIHLLDLTGEELEHDLAGADEPGGVRRALRGFPVQDPAAAPALLAVLRSFADSESDLAVLGGLARLGRELGAPCLTAAEPSLVGIPHRAALPDVGEWGKLPEAWTRLRTDEAARYLGLALPRFLLRMPYGEESDECEAFAFEELPEAPLHDQLLWGNPAAALAALLAESFAESGWRMRPGMHRELRGLPLPLFRRGGEVVAQSPVEAVIGEDAAEHLLERGIMPLVPIRDRDAARLVRFQSIAQPLAPLAGGWMSP